MLSFEFVNRRCLERRVKCLTSTALRGKMLIFHVSGSVTIVIYLYTICWRILRIWLTVLRWNSVWREREGSTETERECVCKSNLRDYYDRERVNFPHWKREIAASMRRLHLIVMIVTHNNVESIVMSVCMCVCVCVRVHQTWSCFSFCFFLVLLFSWKMYVKWKRVRWVRLYQLSSTDCIDIAL